MSAGSGIEWTDATWNPVVGCAKVSEGCRNCYAMRDAARIAGAADASGAPTAIQKAYMGVVKRKDGKPLAQWNNKVVCIPERLEEPLRWTRPRRVFVNSMSDLFHPSVPFEFIDKVWETMGRSRQHTFQILTKRPERMAAYFADVKETAECVHGPVCEIPLPNVWLGTSCEDQAAADARIPHLLKCPAAVRFLSCEPLLGAIDLCNEKRDWIRPLKSVFRSHPPICTGVQWVIVGGESGPGARPCDIGWVRSIVGQCREAGVPCFVKQMGARPVDTGMARWPKETKPRWCDQVQMLDRKGGDPCEWPEDLRVREMPGGAK